MKCEYCGLEIFDGRLLSGAKGLDLCTIDGDFGCDDNPENNQDEVGNHTIEVIRKLDKKGELI
jgi:hypothetical protein